MINIKILREGAIIPRKEHKEDAGYDLFTAVDFIIPAGERRVIPTGIAMKLPKGNEGEIKPRSGISSKGLMCIEFSENNNDNLINAYIDVIIGTIDCNYTGEIGIISQNNSENDVIIPMNTKLAQMVVREVKNYNIEVVNDLGKSERGENGFGSTGV